MTDKVQKIRAFLVGIADADGVSTILAKAIEKKILPYIDSLQEEPVIEDLKEAARKYEENRNDLDARSDNEVVRRAFVAGVNWHKQQMIKSAKLSGWVARDENGFLHLFEVEPSRIMHRWWDRDYHSTTLDNKDFPDLEWEDEPVYVKLPIIVED